MKDTFGQIFKFHSFGESHGPALGCVIEGCPAGLPFDLRLLEKNLQRRRPGQNNLVSARNEEDKPEILSGVFEEKTLGTPIAIVIRNHDQRSKDYEKLPDRRGHATDVWQNKFGHSDHRGGGRASGRETVARVIAGAVAEMLIQKLSPETKIMAWTSQVGPFKQQIPLDQWPTLSREQIDLHVLRTPQSNPQAEQQVAQAKENCDSLGGEAQLVILYPPKNLGQPVFHKLKADFASALMSIGAVTAVELGAGSEATNQTGLDFHQQQGTEVYGGIRGGISTGEPIHFKISVKPTSSILDVAKKGRHDPFLLPRMIPVIEAMAACVIADHLLWSRLDRIE